MGWDGMIDDGGSRAGFVDEGVGEGTGASGLRFRKRMG